MKTEASGSSDFISLWSGQAPGFSREAPAGDITRTLAREALAKLSG